MARPKLSDAERKAKEQEREQENARLQALKESDPAAYKVERERIRQESFKRVAARRTKAALVALEMIKPVANRNNYSFTDEQSEKILSMLDAKFQEVVAAFTATEKKRDEITVEL